MRKIEIIWRELLFEAIEKKHRQFTQKELAAKFDFSTSTVFQALKVPRKMGAVRVTGRNFILEDPEKLLYHWASVRNLANDVIFAGNVNLPVFEIEGRIPPGIVYGGFTAARNILEGNVPADYDKVYFYLNSRYEKEETQLFRARFKFGKGTPNLYVLAGDKFIIDYGQTTTISQTFVDLWNMPEWYAREYAQALREKIIELFL